MNLHVAEHFKAKSLEEQISYQMNQAIGMHLGDSFEEALEIYKLILKLHPDHTEANYNVGIIEIIWADLERL